MITSTKLSTIVSINAAESNQKHGIDIDFYMNSYAESITLGLRNYGASDEQIDTVFRFANLGIKMHTMGTTVYFLDTGGRLVKLFDTGIAGMSEALSHAVNNLMSKSEELGGYQYELSN